MGKDNMNESLDQILKEITKDLSGDTEKDIKYLNKKCEEYKNHQYSKEIIRALSRIIYDLLPEENKKDIFQIVSNRQQSYQSALDEVRFNMFKKDFEKALSLIQSLVDDIENLGFFQDDQASEYYTFNSWFEEILYKVINEPERDVRRADFPYSHIYFLYGNILVELGRVEEAEKVLKEALRWNPCDSMIRFEYLETLKMRGMLKEYLEGVSEAFKYIYDPIYLARAYRDLGYYFIEKKMYPEATTMYYLSLEFDKENKNATSELYYIEQTVGKRIQPLEMTELRRLAEIYAFPIGADRRVLSVAYSIGKKLFDYKNPNAAYFLNIVYKLTKDNAIHEMIAQIEKTA